ncbi:MAG: hypothetical protein ABIQ44_05350, partial [Chloroflexia bacterium]
LITLVSVGLLLKWLGRKGIFAIGWFAIALLLTLQAVALRWFYLPALTFALLVALIYAKLTTQDSKLKSPQLAIALVSIFTAWFACQTIAHNVQWQESGEQARNILAQIKQLHPNPTLPATFYIANPPYSHKDVLLFNTGMDAAIFHVYNDWTNIKSYSLTEDTAQIQSALADPNMIGPNPIFLRYENGKIVEYPDLQTLKAAGP